MNITMTSLVGELEELYRQYTEIEVFKGFGRLVNSGSSVTLLLKLLDDGSENLLLQLFEEYPDIVDWVNFEGEFEFMSDDELLIAGGFSVDVDSQNMRYFYNARWKGIAKMIKQQRTTGYEVEIYVSDFELIQPTPPPDEDTTPVDEDNGDANGTSDSGNSEDSDNDAIPVDGGGEQDPVVSESDTESVVDTENQLQLEELNNEVLNKEGILSNRVNVILTGRFGNLDYDVQSPYQASILYTTSELGKIADSYEKLSKDQKLKLFKSFDRYRLGLNEYLKISKSAIRSDKFEGKKELKEWAKEYKIDDLDIDRLIEYGFSRRNHMIAEKFKIDNNSNPFEWIPFKQKRLTNDTLNRNILNIMKTLTAGYPAEENFFFALGVPAGGQPDILKNYSDENTPSSVSISSSDLAISADSIYFEQSYRPWFWQSVQGVAFLPIRKFFNLNIILHPPSLSRANLAGAPISDIVRRNAQFRIFNPANLSFSNPMGFVDITKEYSSMIEGLTIAASGAGWGLGTSDAYDHLYKEFPKAETYIFQMLKNELISYIISRYVRLYSGYDISEENFPLFSSDFSNSPSEEFIGSDLEYNGSLINKFMMSPAANPSGFLRKAIAPKIFDRVYYAMVNMKEIPVLLNTNLVDVTEYEEFLTREDDYPETPPLSYYRVKSNATSLVDNFFGRTSFSLKKFGWVSEDIPDTTDEALATTEPETTPPQPDPSPAEVSPSKQAEIDKQEQNQQADPIPEDTYILPNITGLEFDDNGNLDEILTNENFTSTPQNVSHHPDWDLEIQVKVRFDRQLSTSDKIIAMLVLKDDFVTFNSLAELPLLKSPMNASNWDQESVGNGNFTYTNTYNLKHFYNPLNFSSSQNSYIESFINNCVARFTMSEHGSAKIGLIVYNYRDDSSVPASESDDRVKITRFKNAKFLPPPAPPAPVAPPAVTIRMGATDYNISRETATAIHQDILDCLEDLQEQQRKRGVLINMTNNEIANTAFSVQHRIDGDTNGFYDSYTNTELNDYLYVIMSTSGKVPIFYNQRRTNQNITPFTTIYPSSDRTEIKGWDAFNEYFDIFYDALKNVKTDSPNDAVTGAPARRSLCLDKQVYFYNKKVANGNSVNYDRSIIPQMQRLLHYWTISAIILCRAKARIASRISDDSSVQNAPTRAFSNTINLSLISDPSLIPFFHYHKDDIYNGFEGDLSEYPTKCGRIKNFWKATVADETAGNDNTGSSFVSNEYFDLDRPGYENQNGYTQSGWRLYTKKTKEYANHWLGNLGSFAFTGVDTNDTIHDLPSFLELLELTKEE